MNKRFTISLLGFLILVPFFISIGIDGNLAMNRLGGQANQSWLITLPISFILAFLMMITMIKNIIFSKEILFYFIYFSMCFLTILISNEIDYSAIKVLILMSAFISSLFGFQLFFQEKLKDIVDLKSAENKFILYPLVLILLLALLSYYYFTSKIIPANQEPIAPSTFLIESIAIYNWEQYFAFIFVLLLGSAASLNFIVFGFLFLLSLHFGDLTANTTSLILMMCFFGIFIFYKIISKRLHHIFIKLIVSLLLAVPLVYLLFGSFIIELFNISEHGLITRYNMVQTYFSKIYWHDFILPFGVSRPFDADYHNEFIEVFNASSLFGFIFYYYFILKRVLSYKVEYKMQMFSILLVIFIGGITVENTLHPYMLVSLAYFISFYAAASKKIKNEMIAKTVW